MKKITLFIVLTFYAMFCFSQGPTVYLTNGGNGYSVIEGNTYTFTVSMYSAATTDVIVDVATIANTADNSDYMPLNTTITIPAGQISSNQLTIPTSNDATIELNESFTIQATVSSNNTANTNISRVITLWDNDTTPTVNTNTTPSLVEGQGSNYYSVYLSNYFSSDVTVDISTTAGTADASDYIETTTSLIIPEGQLSASFSIITQDDNITEVDENYTITANITSSNTTNNSITITVTIKDNDTTPTLSVNSYYTTEGNSTYIYVNLDRAFNSAVVVQMTTSNGTADNSDYTSLTQTKTIGAGSTGINFIVYTTDDTLDEPEETVNFTAAVTSGNTTNTDETGSFYIIDNDGLPDFSLRRVYNNNDPNGQSGDSLVAEEGYDLKFRPWLTNTSPVDTEIEITTTNGTADNSDYTTSTIIATIPAGQYYADEYYSYPTTLDQLDEEDENIFVNAIVTSGNTYNTNYTLEGFILDNYTINAQRDNITAVLEVGATFQVLDNDTFEGLPVNATDLNVSFVSTNSVGITLSSTGILTIPVHVPIGYYNLNYEICEAANPTSCDTASIIIRVVSPLEVTYTVTYADSNGDGFTSVGDTVAYEFTVTNNGNVPIIDIDAIVEYQDLDIIGGPLASLGAGQTDSTTFTALYIITQDDINFGYFAGDLEGAYFYGTYYGNEQLVYLYDESQYFQLQLSDGIELNAFVDTNGNGTQETGEINFPLGQFNYEVNNDGVINNLYVSPHYLYESNPSTIYELSYSVDADYAANNTTATSYSNITVPVGSGITTYDFPISVTPYNDLAIDISSSWRPPVPGFHYWNYISYTNNSNETVTSGTLDFTMNSALSLLSVHEVNNFWYNYNPATVTTTANGFSYMFSNLQPYQTKRLWVRMQVPTLPEVSLGQLVTNTVHIELLSGDIVPLNNTSSLTETIVGSYDPNDIAEKHGEDILFSSFSTEDYLTYTVRFENTGTANAINIRVEDLLDDQLDQSTLKMVDTSHPYSLERVGNLLKWNFFGVNLPPSEDNDSQVGHGFITFKIKPFPDYAIGDVIPNTAEIYFDFNPAITTNTWNTTFVETLGVTESEFSNLIVYPNPVKDILLISNNSEISTIEISSMLGQQILAKSVDALTTEIDLGKFSDGVYFVKIKSKNGERIMKVLKE